jgi:hypothetical protein
VIDYPVWLMMRMTCTILRQGGDLFYLCHSGYIICLILRELRPNDLWSPCTTCCRGSFKKNRKR